MEEFKSISHEQMQAERIREALSGNYGVCNTVELNDLYSMIELSWMTSDFSALTKYIQKALNIIYVCRSWETNSFFECDILNILICLISKEYGETLRHLSFVFLRFILQIIKSEIPISHFIEKINFPYDVESSLMILECLSIIAKLNPYYCTQILQLFDFSVLMKEFDLLSQKPKESIIRFITSLFTFPSIPDQHYCNIFQIIYNNGNLTKDRLSLLLWISIQRPSYFDLTNSVFLVEMILNNINDFTSSTICSALLSLPLLLNRSQISIDPTILFPFVESSDSKISSSTLFCISHIMRNDFNFMCKCASCGIQQVISSMFCGMCSNSKKETIRILFLFVQNGIINVNDIKYEIIECALCYVENECDEEFNALVLNAALWNVERFAAIEFFGEIIEKLTECESKEISIIADKILDKLSVQ